jgi:hypothetical protein
MYEYGTLKPVKVILRRSRGRGKIMERMNQIRVIYMEVSQQNPLHIISYTNKKNLKKTLF